LYGFGKEIKSVTQAVTLFGMKQTKSIALGYAVKKLLNVDMRPYGITSDKFAEISALQATLITKWYNHIDKDLAQTLHLAAFLQETGKILIASDIIQEDEDISFASEVAVSNNIAQVELSYVGVTTSEVTAAVFEHWGFGEGFIEMIRYADKPKIAPEDLQELSMALHIVKTALPVNKPFSEVAINFALRKARDAGYDHEILEDVIDEMLDTMEKA
jgi:HD-like signal output (HDOD) protein